MNNFIVNKINSKLMKFSCEFDEYAKQNGIRNPFGVSQNLFAEKIRHNEDGSLSFEIE